MDAEETMRKAQSDTDGGDATRLRSERPFPSASTSRRKGSARKRCASWYLVTAVQGCIDGAGRRVAFTGHVAWNVAGDAMLGVRGQDGNLVWRSRPGNV